jgi:hypothetical protein
VNSDYFASTLTAIWKCTLPVPKITKTRRASIPFYPPSTWLLPPSPRPSLLSSLSSLASTHTTHQIVLIRCVQCVELKESIRMHCGWSAHQAINSNGSRQACRTRVARGLLLGRASRAHQLTSKQHPWASRASVAARVVSRACPRLSQHWRRSPTKSRRCWQLPCRRNTID